MTNEKIEIIYSHKFDQAKIDSIIANAWKANPAAKGIAMIPDDFEQRLKDIYGEEQGVLEYKSRKLSSKAERIGC